MCVCVHACVRVRAGGRVRVGVHVRGRACITYCNVVMSHV